MDEPRNDESLRRDLLLADLRSWNESFWKNEDAGERRIRFYITLVTAVLAGLGTLYEVGLREGPGFEEIPIGLGALLLFGLVTFFRMVRRNQVTDEYKEWGDEIRRHVLGEPLFEGIYGIERRRPRSRSLWNGGLTSMMLVMNGAVAGVLAGVLLSSAGLATAWAGGAIVLVLACWAQRVFERWRCDLAARDWEERRERRARARAAENPPR